MLLRTVSQKDRSEAPHYSPLRALPDNGGLRHVRRRGEHAGAQGYHRDVKQLAQWQAVNANASSASTKTAERGALLGMPNRNFDGLRSSAPGQRTKSLRDIPVRGGTLLIAMQLGRASTVGRAEPCITVAEAKYSSTVEHELRCFGRRRRSPTSSLCEVMRNAVLGATPVPGCPSRPHRSVHVSHSRFAGLQHGLRSGSQLPVETWVLPFCSSRWSHK